jgi:hypothetical protein
MILSSGRNDAAPPTNEKNSVVVFRCTFSVAQDSLIPVATAGWFNLKFPNLAQRWTTIAPVRSDVYEAQEQGQASVSRADEGVKLLGIETKARSLGIIGPLIIAALLAYMSTFLHSLRHSGFFADPRPRDAIESKLSPWICTDSTWAAVLLSIVSLIVAPALSVSLAIRYSTPSRDAGITWLGCLVVVGLGITVLLQALAIGNLIRSGLGLPDEKRSAA